MNTHTLHKHVKRRDLEHAINANRLPTYYDHVGGPRNHPTIPITITLQWETPQ